MAGVYVPSKLQNICLRNVIERLDENISEIAFLPEKLKDKMLVLVSKRGKLVDANIRKLLHSNVTEIDLSHSEISDDGLKEICYCKELRKLDLNASKGSRLNISPEGIRMLAESCKLLEIVFLRRCELLDDSAIACLTRCCPNLTQLNLEGCSLITDLTVQCIAKWSSKLESLNLSKTKVTDKGLQSISIGCCSKSLAVSEDSLCKINVYSPFIFCSLKRLPTINSL